VLVPLVGAQRAMPLAMAHIAQALSQQAAMLANLDHFALVAVLGFLGIAVTLLQRVFR
jgi:hypothetical protein